MPTLNLPALTLVTGLQRLYTCNGTSASDQAALLIGGRRILGLLTAAEAAAAAAALGPTVLDAAGLIAAPGLVDLHVHVCGGGGESGPASRTPEAQLSELLNAGMTTVVGVLGTDSVSRSQVRGRDPPLQATAVLPPSPPAAQPAAAAAAAQGS